MGIVNRRNAMLGWAAWNLGKRVAKRRAKSAVPAIDMEARRPNKSAVLVGLVAVGVVLWLWWKQQDEDATEPPG